MRRATGPRHGPVPGGRVWVRAPGETVQGNRGRVPVSRLDSRCRGLKDGTFPVAAGAKLAWRRAVGTSPGFAKLNFGF